MSLGYVLLGHPLMTALEPVGLDPYLGFLHYLCARCLEQIGITSGVEVLGGEPTTFPV